LGLTYRGENDPNRIPADSAIHTPRPSSKIRAKTGLTAEGRLLYFNPSHISARNSRPKLSILLYPIGSTRQSPRDTRGPPSPSTIKSRIFIPPALQLLQFGRPDAVHWSGQWLSPVAASHSILGAVPRVHFPADPLMVSLRLSQADAYLLLMITDTTNKPAKVAHEDCQPSTSSQGGVPPIGRPITGTVKDGSRYGLAGSAPKQGINLDSD
jgi:hypothetical protein